MGVPPARLTEVNSARRAAVAVLLALLLAAVGFAAPAPAPAPRPARAALEGLQASVEKAVARASRPAGFLFGRPSRAYHLKGYGAVVVLAPRALPRQRGPAGPRAQDRAFLDMMRDLERSVGEVHDPVQRRRLEETLAALREGLPAGGRRPPRPRAILVPGDIEDLQEEAEAFRREAEQAMQKAERDVMIRLRVPDDALPAVPPAPPAPPRAPAARPPGVPRVPPVLPVPSVEAVPAPPAAPAPDAPEAPVLAGWPFWFGEERADASPERVLSDVRAAIVSGLAGARARWRIRKARHRRRVIRRRRRRN